MAKAIPKIGSRKNGRIGSRKHPRKIPKGVIYVQASFNNTIITVTDPQGRVVFWSSAGTCGFKSSRKASPYAGQRTAVDAIRTVGLQRAEVMVKGAGSGRDAALRAIAKSEEVAGSTQTLQWKCVESRVDSKRLYYGRFILSPLRKGQADTVGIALRRALLGEIEGTCITRAKSEKIPHEYSTIVGIQESIHEILMNLKEIVLRSNLYGVRDASICVKGPRYITAQDIILPPSVETVDTAQPIANLTEPIDFCIDLQIKRDRGYQTELRKNYQDGSYPIDAVSMPVRNVNYSIFSCGNGNEKHEILFLEIWTNGSLTPKEALYEASRNLIDLFLPFLHAEEEGTSFEENKNRFTPPLFTFQKRLTNLKKNKKGIPLNCIFIDQLELTSRTYNCLKRANIHTLLDLLSKTEEDLMRIDSFRMEDRKHIWDTLEKHLPIDLLKNKLSF
ncbi:DNA-directed RNA polymerase subunit alpha [Medicago truncatula]|uniref:DNA-directed RNA polymerase n=1 Tax=Medicago truncatula TaxID=3880 RepID=A0A072TJJ2_MEDTR|nr:DNA-directed RNA polymerase subunit alpha [Medicago truncatula]